MRHRLWRFGACLAALSLVVGLAAPAPVWAQDDRSYLLATAGTGGTYYPVGVAIATLVAVRLQPEHDISMSAITSAGSGENIRLLADDQAQFAILQGLWGAHARGGTGPVAPLGPQASARSSRARRKPTSRPASSSHRCSRAQRRLLRRVRRVTRCSSGTRWKHSFNR